MFWIRVGVKDKETGVVTPTLLNLDTVERFAIINKGTPLEYVEVVYKDQCTHDLSTSVTSIVNQLESFNILQTIKKKEDEKSNGN